MITYGCVVSTIEKRARAEGITIKEAIWSEVPDDFQTGFFAFTFENSEGKERYAAFKLCYRPTYWGGLPKDIVAEMRRAQ